MQPNNPQSNKIIKLANIGQLNIGPIDPEFEAESSKYTSKYPLGFHSWLSEEKNILPIYLNQYTPEGRKFIRTNRDKSFRNTGYFDPLSVPDRYTGEIRHHVVTKTNTNDPAYIKAHEMGHALDILISDPKEHGTKSPYSQEIIDSRNKLKQAIENENYISDRLKLHSNPIYKKDVNENIADLFAQTARYARHNKLDFEDALKKHIDENYPKTMSTFKQYVKLIMKHLQHLGHEMP